MPDNWRNRVLALIEERDETEIVKAERARLIEKLRRLRTAWLDVEIDEDSYRKEKHQTEMRLASLVVPDGLVKIEEAASRLDDMSATWEAASMRERHDMLGLIFHAIYCDPRERRLVAPQPKEQFISLLREVCDFA